MLAFDPAGRRLVHISGVATYEDRVVGDSLHFLGGNAATGTGVLRYDFVTGSLSRLGPAQKRGPRAPTGHGDDVLWYDRDGRHVARIPQ